MSCVFIQIRCHPGQTYTVADAIYEREIVSEMYSTSGDFDLLIKLYIEDGADIGKYIHEHILNIEGIQHSNTIFTFQAF